jgi:hypothetical protein
MSIIVETQITILKDYGVIYNGTEGGDTVTYQDVVSIYTVLQNNTYPVNI